MAVYVKPSRSLLFFFFFSLLNLLFNFYFTVVAPTQNMHLKWEYACKIVLTPRNLKAIQSEHKQKRNWQNAPFFSIHNEYINDLCQWICLYDSFDAVLHWIFIISQIRIIVCLKSSLHEIPYITRHNML